MIATHLSIWLYSYLLQDKSVGEYELKANVEVSGDGYSDMEYTFNYTIHVVDEPFALNFDAYCDNGFEADKPTASNGETFSDHIELARRSEFHPIPRLIPV